MHKVLCHGNNLEILEGMESSSVDLIYLDPPYFTQRDWGKFTDKWKDRNQYLAYLKIRLLQMRRVLKKTGSIYLHCDPTASHYIKIIMDNLFGGDFFKNEIIWQYRTGGASKNFFGRKHDVIFFYTKSKKYTFHIDKEKSYLTGSMGHKKDKTVYEDSNGYYQKVIFSKTEIKLYKDNVGYFTMVNGRDCWQIDAVGRTSKERVDYPTQKPLALLDRIIKASSNKGDMVLDPFCGSGTTLVSAQNLERNFIGIDLSEEAISIARSRLN